MTKFRYDVTLHVGSGVQPGKEVEWNDWDCNGLTLDSVRHSLTTDKPEIRAIKNVPNRRLRREVRLIEALRDQKEGTVVSKLREIVESSDEFGVDPDELRGLGNQLGYAVQIIWQSSNDDGRYDVVFEKESYDHSFGYVAPELNSRLGSIEQYVNQPRLAAPNVDIVAALRSYLRAKLPPHMVPSRIVVLDAFPLTPNRKIDRKALAAISQAAPAVNAVRAEPRSPVEKSLAGLWAEVLGREQVGIDENFFDLGGHSLLATQLISRLRAVFKVNLAMNDLFGAPTIRKMARMVTAREARPGQTEKIAAILLKIGAMSPEALAGALEQKRMRETA